MGLVKCSGRPSAASAGAPSGARPDPNGTGGRPCKQKVAVRGRPAPCPSLFFPGDHGAPRRTQPQGGDTSQRVWPHSLEYSSKAGARQRARGPQQQPPACQRRARLQHAQPSLGAAASPQPGTHGPGAAAARAGLSRAPRPNAGRQPAQAAVVSHGAGCQRLSGFEEQCRTGGDFQGHKHLAWALLLALPPGRASRQQLVGPNPRAPVPVRAEVTHRRRALTQPHEPSPAGERGKPPSPRAADNEVTVPGLAPHD